MKLCQLLEVRYVGATNSFIITWPNDDWNPGDVGAGTHYTFGKTEARKGFYLRGDQLVAVQSDNNRAIEKMKNSMMAWEQGMYGEEGLKYEKKEISEPYLDEVGRSLEKGEQGGWEYFRPMDFVDFMMAKS